MKIAFVGSHSVGKTTACWYVGTMLKQEGYNSVELLPELARVCPLPINEKSTFATTLWILLEQMKSEYFMLNKLSHKKQMILLLDRSIFDNYAYGIAMQPCKEKFLRTIIEAWAKEHPYNALLYFPIGWKPVDDGIRSTYAEYQKSIDDTVWAYVAANHNDILHHVNGKTHAIRCKNALKIVKKVLEASNFEK